MITKSISQVYNWLKSSFEHQNMMLSLNKLSERELKDMGITKYDIHAIGRGYYNK